MDFVWGERRENRIGMHANVLPSEHDPTLILGHRKIRPRNLIPKDTGCYSTMHVVLEKTGLVNPTPRHSRAVRNAFRRKTHIHFLSLFLCSHIFTL